MENCDKVRELHLLQRYNRRHRRRPDHLCDQCILWGDGDDNCDDGDDDDNDDGDDNDDDNDDGNGKTTPLD